MAMSFLPSKSGFASNHVAEVATKRPNNIHIDVVVQATNGQPEKEANVKSVAQNPL